MDPADRCRLPYPGSKEVRLLIKAIGLNRSEILTRFGKAPSQLYPRNWAWRRRALSKRWDRMWMGLPSATRERSSPVRPVVATIASLPWLRGKNARQNTSRPELAGSGNDLDRVRRRLDRADRYRPASRRVGQYLITAASSRPARCATSVFQKRRRTPSAAHMPRPRTTTA